MVERISPASTGKVRRRAAVILTGSLLILGVALWLEPDPSGFGTHCQLGLSGCTLPMLTGYPCPSCGMTTAFAYAVRGRFISAFTAQPAGLCLALATFVAAWLSACTLVTGRVWRINAYRISMGWVAFAVVGVILIGWGLKIVLGWMTGRIPLP